MPDKDCIKKEGTLSPRELALELRKYCLSIDCQKCEFLNDQSYCKLKHFPDMWIFPWEESEDEE